MMNGSEGNKSRRNGTRQYRGGYIYMMNIEIDPSNRSSGYMEYVGLRRLDRKEGCKKEIVWQME